jgi:hypothetical protein
MLKILLLASLVALSSLFATTTAQAGTITLDADACSDNRFCYSVPNDGGYTDLLLYANASGSGVVEVQFADGTIWLGTGPVGTTISSYPVYRQPNKDAVMYVTANWMTWTTKGSCSGRGGCASHTHWSLLSGSLLTQ